MTPSVHVKESAFHDEWARQAATDGVDIVGAFEHITAMENRFILRRMQPLQGRRVLDVGCGLGESSIYFARQGAMVTSTDISPGMIELVRSHAAKAGVAITAKVTPAERLDFEDSSFDFVYIGNLIHHVPSAARPAFYRELRRVLRPGGMAFCIEPLSYNPLINCYRLMAKNVRTEDERPLRWRDLREIRAVFPRARFSYFWITTLILFVKFYIVDRINPNEQRYWKIITALPERSLWWWKPMLYIDVVLTRLPPLNWLCSWNVVAVMPCRKEPIDVTAPS